MTLAGRIVARYPEASSNLLRALLVNAEALLRSAMERKESRGAHFRDDFPAKDESFGTFNITLKKGKDGEMRVLREPLPRLAPELKQVIEEMK